MAGVALVFVHRSATYIVPVRVCRFATAVRAQDLAITECVACLGESVLGVHHFQHRRFASLMRRMVSRRLSAARSAELFSNSSSVVIGFGFSIQFSHICLEFALSHGEFALGLLASQVGLHYFAARRAPIPYRDIQRRRHRIAKVARAIGLMRREVWRINAVKIIERQRGEDRRFARTLTSNL